MVTEGFKGAPWFNRIYKLSVIIGGAGGIGSWLSFFLASCNADIILYDNDIVEESNIGGQFFNENQIYESKVSAVADNIGLFCNLSINYNESLYDENSFASRYMFSCFDNMEARKTMFEKWVSFVEKKENKDDALFIDGRLEAEMFIIYCVNYNNKDKYYKTLVETGLEERNCTFKQTRFVAANIAAKMTSFLTNYLTNLETETSDRVVPFRHQEYLAINYTSQL